MVLGMGINTHHRYRYAIGAAFGMIFYGFCGFWAFFNPVSSLSLQNSVLILIAIGLLLLLITCIFEWRKDTSIFQRQAIVFLTISIAGLPLFMIKNVIEGEAAGGYPGSLLPLLGFGLVLIALLLVANILESRIYARKEGRIRERYGESDDIKLDALGEAKDKLKAQEDMLYPSNTVPPLKVTDWEDIEFDYQMTRFWRR